MSDKDYECGFHERLAKAIELLTHELSEMRKERTAHLVTRSDLRNTEGRILDAIHLIIAATAELSDEDQRLLDQLLARTSKHLFKLEALDAKTV